MDNKWLKFNSFRSLVVDTWKNTPPNGTTNFKIAKKLKRLKIEIKKWTKDMGLREEEHTH